jgi:hypothetical protein
VNFSILIFFSLLNCHQSISTDISIPSWKKTLRNTAIFVVPRHLGRYPPRMIYDKSRSTWTPRNSYSAVNQNAPLTRGHQTSPTLDESSCQFPRSPPTIAPRSIGRMCMPYRDNCSSSPKGDTHCIFSDPDSASPVQPGKNDVGMSIDVVKNRG